MVLNSESPDRMAAFAARPALTGANWLVGAAFTVSAAVVATVLAIVFAATMAVVVVVMGAALGAWAAAVRVRQGLAARPVRASGPQMLEARKVGHAWVAYGWDQNAR